MIQRTIEPVLRAYAEQFPVVALMGPRQSGKTTLARAVFPDYRYITLEDLDRKAEAHEDPRKFFASLAHEKGVIIDEIQEVPELFSYMQGIVDQEYRPGYFIITGSQNFLMHEKITQTLAGRIALLTLLPLSIVELEKAHKLPQTLEEVLLKGFYPRLYAQNIDIHAWFTHYISTYIEKDVRQILGISNVIAFQRFLKLCAARIGNLVNYADLARDCDISPNTAKAWISVLETSYIIKLLYPYHNNFSKRLIKTPKLYFYDSGLVAAFLGIQHPKDLYSHPMRGALFESLIISDLFKYFYNVGRMPPLYFWRDVQGHEIDCIIEKSLHQLVPLEVKAGMTIRADFFKELAGWGAITGQAPEQGFLIYAGDSDHLRKFGNVISWRRIEKVTRTFEQI